MVEKQKQVVGVIAQELYHQEEAVNALSAYIDELEEKISSVLKGVPVQKEGLKEEERESPVARVLQQHRIRIQDVNKRISNIIQRMEL